MARRTVRDPIDDRLRDPALRRLWASAHRYATSRRRGDQWGSVTITDVSEPERAALERRIHRPSRGRSVTVDLAGLDAWLRATYETTLLTVVESVVGPVANRYEKRVADEASRERFVAAVAAHPADDEAISGWAEANAGRLHRSDFEHVKAALDVVADVRRRAGQVRCLDVVAGQVLADSHALDPETAAGQHLTSILAACSGTAPPATSAETRTLFARFGLEPDQVSSHVLCANVPGVPGPAAVPRRVTLAELADPDMGIATASTPVWVVENPTVLQTLARLGGESCPTLISVEGQPHVAAQQLLVRLAESGGLVRYHSDLGAGGVAITNLVLRLHPSIQPWRMSTADYLEALSRTGGRGPAIRGTVPEATWDAELASVMNETRVEVEEQQVLDLLASDIIQS